VPEDFEEKVRGAYPVEEKQRGPNRVTREKVLENARAYLNAKWTLRKENYERTDIPSNCAPAAKQMWLRPKHLIGRIGEEIEGITYKWGGYQSLPSILDKLEKGYIAGDICTCRKSSLGYCITEHTVGVDCSGFVSRITEQNNYYTTTSIAKIAEPVKNWRDVKPGCVVNFAGRHVRAIVGIRGIGEGETGPVIVDTIESAVSCGGVCEASYTVEQLRNYKAYCFKNVVDGP
jgi:hypothetical protein